MPSRPAKLTTASTMAWSATLSRMFDTKERSIFSRSMGRLRTRFSDAAPVPKSSSATLMPRARKNAISAMSVSRSIARQRSVSSMHRFSGGKPVLPSAPTTASRKPVRPICVCDTFTLSRRPGCRRTMRTPSSSARPMIQLPKS